MKKDTSFNTLPKIDTYELPNESKAELKNGKLVFTYDIYGVKGKIVFNKNHSLDIDDYIDARVPNSHTLHVRIFGKVLNLISKNPRLALRELPNLFFASEEITQALKKDSENFYNNEFIKIMGIEEPWRLKFDLIAKARKELKASIKSATASKANFNALCQNYYNSEMNPFMFENLANKICQNPHFKQLCNAEDMDNIIFAERVKDLQESRVAEEEAMKTGKTKRPEIKTKEYALAMIPKPPKHIERDEQE